MKRNALIRIIIWSITLLVLVGIFGGMMEDYSERRMEKAIWSSLQVTAPLTEDVVPTEAPINAYYSDGRRNTYPTSLSELEIEWVAGDILIQPGDTDEIIVKEDGVSDPRYNMVLQWREDTLKIIFCEEEGIGDFIGFGSSENLNKDLTITVPRDWICKSLEIGCASATVEVNDMTIQEVDFDGASGTCEFENCQVREMDIDTASGDVRFIGSLQTLDCDAASASIYAVLSNTPSRLDMDTMSGDLDITLPPDAGFALSMDAANGDFESDFETTMKNGNYVCGDGQCRINVDAMSGDVIIRKGETA